MVVRRVAILGVGLLGGSLALAIRRASGCRIIGYGHRPETLRTALDHKVIDESYDDPAVAVREADLVVLCTPVGAFGDLIRRIGPELGNTAVVTDVGSTKRSVVRLAGALPRPARFVGSHPMAGSEKRGVEHADADLFRGAVCVVTPTDDADPTALAMVEDVWRSVGMRVVRMTAADHDARVAVASHLPHAVAAALAGLQDDASLAIAGRGLADTTRVAAGDPPVWRDIFLDNRDNLCDGIVQMKARLDELLGHLNRADADATKAWLADAAKARESFPPRP